MNLKKFYQDQSDALDLQIKQLRGRAHGFVIGEIATFLASVACLVTVTLTHHETWRLLELLTAALFAMGYVLVRQRDTRNDKQIHRLEDLKQVYDNELSGLRGDFGCFDDGQRYVDPHHAYTYDLDIFGRDGLYQRLCRLVTTGGCDAMANRLSSLDGRGEMSGPEARWQTDTQAYREEIEALAANEKFRSEFVSYGVREKIDTDAIRRALRAAAAVKVPGLFGHELVLALAAADLVAFLASIVLAGMDKVSGMVPLWWGVAQFFGIYLLCTGPLRRISQAINRLHGQLRQLVNVVRLMDSGGADVFRRLSGLLDGLDKRGNIMGLMMVDTFALYDFFLVRKFLKWRVKDSTEMEQWIDRVIRMDQDVTVATFLYNHPRTSWPVLTEANAVGFEASDLYHPFLGEKAVSNDFRIDDRHFYIITGANMAGKSTFLRAIGVNYILARVGFPVFAKFLQVSKFKLFSSMRTSDDLAHGISYFNAELLRLRQLLQSLSPCLPPRGERGSGHSQETGETIGQDELDFLEKSAGFSQEKAKMVGRYELDSLENTTGLSKEKTTMVGQDNLDSLETPNDLPQEKNDLNVPEGKDVFNPHTIPPLPTGRETGGEASLIILDEILKGTNSLDKLNGSRLFLKSVGRMNVTGIVATHDLELSKMEDERFHNYCFEIELGADVTYSYRITPGVARNQNATFLLKQLLSEI